MAKRQILDLSSVKFEAQPSNASRNTAPILASANFNPAPAVIVPRPPITINPTNLGAVVLNTPVFKPVDIAMVRPDILRRFLFSQKYTRKDLKVPIAPSNAIKDSMLFEDPVTSKKYYVPRYVLAKEKISGRSNTQMQYKIALTSTTQGGELTVYLDKTKPPQSDNTQEAAKELKHTLKILLTYQLASYVDNKKSGIVNRQWLFQELTFPDDQVKAVLKISNIDTLNEIYTAMTSQAANTQLIVARMITVAVPD